MLLRLQKILNIFAKGLVDLVNLDKQNIKYQGKTLIDPQKLKKIRVFATTVIRETPDKDLTGFLIELDWPNNSIKQKKPIPLDSNHPFWNERGGNRGGRGVFVYKKILYVATATSILKFDSQLNQIGEIVHPYFGGLHEIYIDSEGIWITASIHDLVMKLDFEGNILYEWWGSESKIIQKSLGFSGRELNLNLDFPTKNISVHYNQYCKEEKLHPNSVYVQNGEVYVLANALNAFIKIYPQPEKVVFQDNQLGSPHNGILTSDGQIIVNDTRNQQIKIYDISGKLLRVINTSIYKTIGRSTQFAKAGWQRGLAHLDNSIYLVGTSPATIFEVDINNGIIGQVCNIDKDVKHCIHGLTVVKDF